MLLFFFLFFFFFQIFWNNFQLKIHYYILKNQLDFNARTHARMRTHTHTRIRSSSRYRRPYYLFIIRYTLKQLTPEHRYFCFHFLVLFCFFFLFSFVLYCYVLLSTPRSGYITLLFFIVILITIKSTRESLIKHFKLLRKILRTIWIVYLLIQLKR